MHVRLRRVRLHSLFAFGGASFASSTNYIETSLPKQYPPS